MKNFMKKVFVLALALIQLVPTTVNAETGTNQNTTGDITIDNAIVGKIYSVYQILKLESYDTTAEAYRYTTTEDAWKTFIESDEIKNVYVVIDEFGYVTWKEGADVKEFSKLALAYAEKNQINPTQTKESVESTTVKFEGLNLGYYLVDSSTGALCGLNTTDKSVTIKEKNTEPSVEKEVKENSTNTYGEKNDAKIGDVVEFKTTITVGAGAQNYVLYDNLSEGLTLLDNETYPIEVKVGDTVVAATNYTKTADTTNGTFSIKFKKEYLDTLTADTKIVVTYSAVLNEKAVIEGEGNTNETYLTYGTAHETTHDYTRTYAYSFNLLKVNSKKEKIEGAEFRLYADEACTNEIALVYDAEKGVYRVAVEGETGTVIKVGEANIVGLDNKTYWLKETKQPEGYNILATPVKVSVKGTELNNKQIIDITESYEMTKIQVENKTGAELPSTGGIGTMLFITIGSIMMLGFGVLLVTKLRMSKVNI